MTIADHYKTIIETIGENPERDGLKGTPLRAQKAIEFLTSGYQQDLNTVINNALFDSDMDELVIVKDIEFYSLCEHHVIPFMGKCHIGYIPNGKVLGLSKFARIVDMFARRLQIQERLTSEVANAIQESISPLGVGVVVEAQHMCMTMRGVQKQNSMMKTSVMLGALRENHKTREEFFNLIR